MERVKIVECPRDAWQGLPRIIPTEAKVAYLRKLLEAGFRHIDAVSFVSPKLVPQMADSESVMAALSGQAAGTSRRAGASDVGSTVLPATDGRPEIIGIVVNEKGLDRALRTPGVTTIGYPHSISERFLSQNANTSVEESRRLVKTIKQRLDASGPPKRELVVYLSMAFGNPYGEAWSTDFVAEEARWLMQTGVRTLSLADTVGKAGPEDVSRPFSECARATEGRTEIGVHLHSRPDRAAEKILAAFEAGCRRFDSALTGLGGCPFAGDELVGNVPTETVVSALAARGVPAGIEPWALLSAVEATKQLRERHAP